MKNYNHQVHLIVSEKEGISSSGKLSQTTEIKSEKYEKEIAELKEEIKA